MGAAQTAGSGSDPEDGDEEDLLATLERVVKGAPSRRHGDGDWHEKRALRGVFPRTQGAPPTASESTGGLPSHPAPVDVTRVLDVTDFASGSLVRSGLTGALQARSQGVENQLFPDLASTRP